MVVTWAYNAGTNTATASGAGSTNFAALVAADIAGGWGKFTADASGTQILCKGKIIIGDGTNACVFTDTLKEVMLANAVVTGYSQSWITISNNSTLTLGVVDDATDQTTSRGCNFKVNESTYSGVVILNCGTSATVNCYSCTFASLTSTKTHVVTIKNNGRLWNCILSYNIYLANCVIDVYNLQIQTTTYYGLNLCTGSFDKLSVTQQSYGAIRIWGNAGCNITDAYIRNVNYRLVNVEGIRTIDTYWVNFNTDTWGFNFIGTCTGVFYRQYTFDLQVTDTDGTAIEDADVLLEQDDGTDAFDVDTDASGLIAEQTVSRGYYAQATGDTLQDYGPFKLTVTKTGYMPYIQDGIVLDEKVDWRISLRAQLTGDASEADVATGKTFYSTDADTQQTGTYTPEPPGGGFYFPVEKKVTVEKIVEKPLNKTLLLLSSNLILQKWKLKRALLLENMLTAQKINKLTENIKKGK